MKQPKKPAEWQEAVDLAAGLRVIGDCTLYGLIAGGPEVSLARCDEILEQGERRGVRPSKSPTDLAIDFVRAFNGSK